MSSSYDKALRESLHIFLLHCDPAKVLRDWPSTCAPKDGPGSPPTFHLIEAYKTVPPNFSYLLPRNHPGQFSIDDASQIAKILQGARPGAEPFSVFQLISTFARQTLVQHMLQPLVRYEHVLRWRQTVHPLGTVPFVCAFLAAQDIESTIQRDTFSLQPILQTDNRRLKVMLSQGMAENHFHLKGSASSFLLAWVSLMNDVTARGSAFRELERLHLGEGAEHPNRSLQVLVTQAATIRAFLFLLLETGKCPEDDLSNLRDLLRAETPVECTAYIRHIQSVLDGMKATFGCTADEDTCPDYAIMEPTAEFRKNPFCLFAGEHRFQYRAFRAFQERNAAFMPYCDLFYAYLMISIRFRAELIQSNRQVGFQNFSEYDRRKGLFIEGRNIFEEAQMVGAAVAGLRDERIRSLEVRTVPRKTSKELTDSIYRTDSLLKRAGISSKVSKRMYYVLHIPKLKDITHQEQPSEYVRCRDFELRNNVKKVADAVIRLREGNDTTACRIRGMDACANEADARPEVFAVAFRRLKRHQPHALPSREGAADMLHLTYHVGEDFLDVVDGLRAVWEAVTFLELDRSDRIGHGLALGIESGEWYAAKQHRVYLTRQALLDNCVWMLEMLGRHGHLDSDLDRQLEEECAIQYAAIYQASLPYQECEMNFDRHNYFCALELRGDAPDCYFNYENSESYLSALELFKEKDSCCLRSDDVHDACYTARRRNLQAIRLYHHYHFNPKTKCLGDEVIEYTISKPYVRAVVQLQQIMRARLAALGIGIETNPSSNVLIGSFKRYDKHPLIKFNDLGLLDLPDNPNLFVSINTDDQGVFDTCLENEYALMARGLEQQQTEDGHPVVTEDRVYRWLDHIRQMGLEQSFGTVTEHFPG